MASSNAQPKPCGCKGVRTCRLCETLKGVQRAGESLSPVTRYVFDVKRGCATSCTLSQATDCAKSTDADWWCCDAVASAPALDTDFDGVDIVELFVNQTEEGELVNTMDQWPWAPSQSGRLKQDFGPKVNFKKKKVKLGNFTGLPAFSQTLLDRMHKSTRLKDFVPVEQCHLDYSCSRGSAIDPHFDDDWVWGERLVTINLLGDTILSFQPAREVASPDFEICVPLPRRSLVVVAGTARFRWKHAIRREDVPERRIAVTLRELGDDFLPGGSLAAAGEELIDVALSFQGLPLEH